MLWDCAVQLDERAFVVEEEGWPEGVPLQHRWVETAGITGVNRLHAAGPLNLLHANARWTAEELIHRVKADLPLEKRSRLSLRSIENRGWGMIADAGEEAAFQLAAASGARFASASWAGTRGLGDLEIELKMGPWFGEVWLFLRSSADRNDRIRVGLMEGELRVLQERDGNSLADRREPVAIHPREGVELLARLEGDRLRLQIPGSELSMEVPVVVPASGECQLEFALYHRIHGAALARDISIIATPLPGTPSIDPPESATESTRAEAELLSGTRSGKPELFGRP
jgi:hypothetical protein